MRERDRDSERLSERLGVGAGVCVCVCVGVWGGVPRDRVEAERLRCWRDGETEGGGKERDRDSE